MGYIILNLCILIIICILIFYRCKNFNKYTNELIKAQGWILYLLDSCPHCDTQLQDLSTFKEYIIYNKKGEIISNGITSEKELMQFNQIKSFPLWYNNITNEKIYGVQDLKTISEQITN